jgi:AcrR family transcriptional regulator
MTSQTLTSVRQEYKEQTRLRIVDSAIDLVAEAGEAPLTIAAVADRAGVTERTVYRHFETRDALLRAIWSRMQGRVASEGFPLTAEALLASPRKLFPRFEEMGELIRASIHSPAGLEIRMHSNAARTEALLTSVRDALPDLDDQALRRRAAVAQLINSAQGWEVLTRFWGMSGEQAGEAAAEALAILLGRRAAHEPSKEEKGNPR